eukprot:UN07986
MSLYNQFKLICEKPILLIKLPKPRNMTINYICNNFIKYHGHTIETENKLNPNEEKSFLKEVIHSIKCFFNAIVDVDILWNESEKK